MTREEALEKAQVHISLLRKDSGKFIDPSVQLSMELRLANWLLAGGDDGDE